MGILSFIFVVAVQSHVYFATGGFEFFRPWQIEKALELLEEDAESLEVDHFEIFHHGNWREVCDDLRQSGFSEPLILIGHSWGATAMADISKCLEKDEIPVDLLITLDRVFKPGFSHVRSKIPDNVVQNLNFYQDKAWFFAGRSAHRREDQSLRGIKNIRVEPSAGFHPHDQIVLDLVETGVIKKLIQVQLAATFDDH